MPVAVVNVDPAPVATVEVAPAPVAVVEEQPAVEVEYQEPAAYVYVNPNVQVIEDYDYPVFYSNNLYWRNEGGVWYSSSYHDRGWGVGVEAPMYIRSIDRPEHFVHYHADVHATVGQPGYRYHPTTPIHHSAPPPRYVEHPGHPVAARPMEPRHEAPRPETRQPQPQHVTQPVAHPVETHPQPQPVHTAQPVAHPQPAATKPDVHPQQATPQPAKAQPPKAPPPAAAPPKKKK